MAESERTRTCLQNRRECERIRLQTRVSGSVTDLVTVFFFQVYSWPGHNNNSNNNSGSRTSNNNWSTSCRSLVGCPFYCPLVSAAQSAIVAVVAGIWLVVKPNPNVSRIP